MTEAELKPGLPPFQASPYFTTPGFKSTYSPSRPIEKHYLIISADQRPHLFLLILSLNQFIRMRTILALDELGSRKAKTRTPRVKALNR